MHGSSSAGGMPSTPIDAATLRSWCVGFAVGPASRAISLTRSLSDRGAHKCHRAAFPLVLSRFADGTAPRLAARNAGRPHAAHSRNQNLWSGHRRV